MKKWNLNTTSFRLILGCLAWTLFSSAQASGPYLIGFGLNDQNPADLNTVNKAEFTVDGILRNAQENINNFTINGVQGAARTSWTNLIPFFRVAYRVNSKLVLGFDYNHPEWFERNYGANTFESSQGFANRFHTYNLNPRMSYQITPYLAFGLGFDAMNVSNRTIATQTPAGGPVFTVLDTGQGWGYGWDAGVSLKATKTTTASLAFFSQINNTVTGLSNYRNISTIATTNTSLPMAFVFRLTQYLRPDWYVRFTGVWAKDSVNQNVTVLNTARGTVISALNQHNTVDFGLLTNYQLNKRLAFTLAGVYWECPRPVDTIRPPSFDSDAWILAAGPTFKIYKTFSLQFLYSRAWYHAPINYISTVPGAVGQVLGSIPGGRNNYEITLSYKI